MSDFANTKDISKSLPRLAHPWAKEPQITTPRKSGFKEDSSYAKLLSNSTTDKGFLESSFTGKGTFVSASAIITFPPWSKEQSLSLIEADYNIIKFGSQTSSGKLLKLMAKL